MWPFRSLIVRSGASQGPESTALRPCQAFYFGDTERIMQAARMSNRLTGYVFLLDAAGRMRWQASGPAQVCIQAPYLGIGTISSGTCSGCKALSLSCLVHQQTRGSTRDAHNICHGVLYPPDCVHLPLHCQSWHVCTEDPDASLALEDCMG